MKIINTIINAVIEILLTSVGLGLIGGFGYIFFTSNAISDSANLMPYLNSFSINAFNALPVHGLAIAVIVIAIFLHLIKGTVADQGQMA